MSHPYKIAVLVYIFNDAGRTLLLKRAKAPNLGRYSPIGGKLEQAIGESPYACALRETQEEIGLELGLDDIRLLGIVSERGYENEAHWLMFCFEVVKPINFPAREIVEGSLEWVDPIIVPELNIPKTDKQVIWPLVMQHSQMLHKGRRKNDPTGGAFFSVHIDCTDHEKFVVTQEHPLKKSEASSQ